MANEYDALIVGAGQNSLTAAAYLAKAGLKVCVFEKNDIVGGGAVTQELTVPGFKHDTHATAIVLVMANPMLRDDELQLRSKFELDFVTPEATNATVFDDESWVGSFPSLDKTCESIAQYSAKDAQTYREFALRTIKMGPMLTQGMFKPPVPGDQMVEVLMQSEEGKEVLGLFEQSAQEFIKGMFEHPKIQMHFLRWAAETHNPLNLPGTGMFFYFLTAVAHTQDQVAAVGGTGSITAALRRCIEHHGGDVRTNTWVKRVLMRGGEAKGVVLADGETVMARRCVVGSIHPHLLGDFVEGLDTDLVEEAKNAPLNAFGGLQAHWALNEAPSYKCDGVPKSLVTHVMPLDENQLMANTQDPAQGKLSSAFCPLVFNQSSHDSTRAPDGKHTLAIYQFAPMELKHAGPLGHGSVDGWSNEIRDEYRDWLLAQYQQYCSNMGSDNILASEVHSPADMAKWTPSFQKGDIFGVSNLIPTGMRPTARLGDYSVPGAKGLYLTGPFCHPGGSVNGGGRGTAIKVLSDLGYDLPSLFNL